MNPTTVEVSAVDSGLKNLIIGKLWLRSNDGTRAGALKISRSLPVNLNIKPGSTLFLTQNVKREGKEKDADYSVSILLPVAIADDLIAKEKVNATRLNLADREGVMGDDIPR